MPAGASAEQCDRYMGYDQPDPEDEDEIDYALLSLLLSDLPEEAGAEFPETIRELKEVA